MVEVPALVAAGQANPGSVRGVRRSLAFARFGFRRHRIGAFGGSPQLQRRDAAVLVRIDPLEHGSERVARGCPRTGSSCRAVPQFLQRGGKFFLPPCDAKPSRILRALHAAGPDLLRSCQRLFRNHQHRRNPVLVGAGTLAGGTILVHQGYCRCRARVFVRSRKIQPPRRTKVTSCLFWLE